MSDESTERSVRRSVRRDGRGEIRLALRRLRRSPGYTLAVVVNLALGIGATTALFAVLYGVVLRPLPYPDPDRLVVIEHEMPGIEMGGQPTRLGAFQGQALHYGERSRQIEAVGVFGTYDAAIADDRSADYVRVGYGSTGFFRALGTRAEAGRLFLDDEPTTGAVLLARSAWSRRYGRDPGAVGAPLRIDGADRRIVGVLGRQGPFPADSPSLWTPRTDAQIRQTPQLLVNGLLARMTAGATASSLARELDQLIAELPERMPDDFIRRAVTEGRLRTRVTPLTEHVVGAVAGSLWLLLAAAGLVLTAALANVTNLQLLRNESQVRELAVRRALGARRIDLVRQHLAEVLVLAALSGTAGLGLAADGVAWVLRADPLDLPRAAEVSLGSLALVVALVITGVSALWLTAVNAARPSGSHALRSASAGGAHSRARVRGSMAAAELAAAVVLLVGAGLVLRSFTALTHVDPGFVPGSVLTFRVPFPFQEVSDAGGSGRATPFYDELADRLASSPGIDSVGYARCTPLSRLCGLEGLTLRRADRPVGSVEHEELFGVLQVGPGYHETLSIPLLAGRYLERGDHEQRTNAVVVSAAVAERLWGGEEPLGQRLVTPDLPGFSPFTVVGVVGEVHYGGLRGAPEAVVYIPVLMREQQWELWTTTFIVRTAVEPLGLVDEIRATVRDLRPDIPIAHVETMTGAVARSTARLRFAVALAVAAALATLVLGATGVYGVIAYAVSLRRGEFGIRLALGADGPALRRLVLEQGMAMAAAGLSAGLAAALLGSRFLESILFGVEPSDPPTYVMVAALLVSTTLLACYLPARRAARVDPAEVLRLSE